MASTLQAHQVLPIGGLTSQLQRFADGGALEDLATAAVRISARAQQRRRLTA